MNEEILELVENALHNLRQMKNWPSMLGTPIYVIIESQLENAVEKLEEMLDH